MKLESIKIENIRSIRNLDLEFPESIMLFYGDIGSGKSSILKAIEFGLFGTMGALSATSLLRRGANKATVELSFSLNGDTYTIHRELKKILKKDKKTGESRETISQPKGWIIENGIKTSYTTTDLRLKILGLLNYSVSKYKSAAKKCIDIYRYTVYTPQEEIKEILLANPSERFEILKDVFEIEKYENTLNNLSDVSKQLRSDLRDLSSDIKALGSPEEIILDKEKEIEVQKKDIASKKKEIQKNKKLLQNEKDVQEKLQIELTEYSKKISEIDEKRKIIEDDQNTIRKNEKGIENLDSEIIEKQKELEGLPDISLKTEKTVDVLENERKTVKAEINDIDQENGNLKKQLGGIQKAFDDIDKLLKEGKCSLCGQEIHEIERFNREKEDANRKLKDLKVQLKQLSHQKNIKETQVKEINDLIKNIQEYEKNNLQRKSFEDLIAEIQKRKQGLKNTIDTKKEKIKISEESIQEALSNYGIDSFEEFRKHETILEEKFQEQKAKVDKIQSEITSLEKQLSTFEAGLITLKKELNELNEKVQKKEKLIERQSYLSNIRDWVQDQLPVLIKDIERTILTSTAVLFNQYFKDWFNILVEEENIDVKINSENFQPDIQVNGYDSPFEDLSGGEKSALSLAYRLALNKVITAKHQDVKSKDLLILDEPTDGFSEQQVNRMQEIFDKLDTRQMIIISHERTLDSFVTDIFNFKKVNHKTSYSKMKDKSV